jgi:hypothetical protein
MCIREVPGSKLAQYTNFRDEVFLDLSQALRAVLKNRPRPLSSAKSLNIFDVSFHNLKFYRAELLTALLNNP